MQDQEFIALRNRFLFSLLITIIFVIPVSILVINKFSSSKSDLLKYIEQKKNIVIYLTTDECSKCEEYQKLLDNEHVAYFELNTKKAQEFKEIMSRIEMTSKYATAPGVVYVENGKLSANIVDIKNSNELLQFIENYDLQNTNIGSD